MIEQLLNYQKTDGNLRKIENELGKSSERKAMNEAKAFMISAKDTIEKIGAKAGELSAQFDKVCAERDAVTGQINDFRSASDNCSDESESSYLLKKAEETMTKLVSLEKETAKLESEIKALLSEYRKIVSDANKMKEIYAKNKEEYAKLKEIKSGEIKEIKDALDKLKKAVDPSVMAVYEKKRVEDKIFPVLVPVVNEAFCGGCGMELSALSKSKLKTAEVVECDFCKRLLYKEKK